MPPASSLREKLSSWYLARSGQDYGPPLAPEADRRSWRSAPAARPSHWPSAVTGGVARHPRSRPATAPRLQQRRERCGSRQKAQKQFRYRAYTRGYCRKEKAPLVPELAAQPCSLAANRLSRTWPAPLPKQPGVRPGVSADRLARGELRGAYAHTPARGLGGQASIPPASW